MSDISRLALATVFTGVSATGAVADGDPWALLDGIEISETVTGNSYTVTKTFPSEIEAGIAEFFITGYAVPLTPGDAVRDLVLVSDMGNCPFCGSGAHGASLTVELDVPIIGLEEGTRISLIGALQPVTDHETWQAVVLKSARVVGS